MSWAPCIFEFVLGNLESSKLPSCAGQREHGEAAKSSSDVGALMYLSQRCERERKCHIQCTSNRSPSASPYTRAPSRTLFIRSSTCHRHVLWRLPLAHSYWDGICRVGQEQDVAVSLSPSCLALSERTQVMVDTLAIKVPNVSQRCVR